MTKGQDQRRGKFPSRKQERKNVDGASCHIRDDAAAFQSASAPLIQVAGHGAHPQRDARHADQFDIRNPKLNASSASANVLRSHKQVRRRFWSISHRTDDCRRERFNSQPSKPVVTLSGSVLVCAFLSGIASREIIYALEIGPTRIDASGQRIFSL